MPARIRAVDPANRRSSPPSSPSTGCRRPPRGRDSVRARREGMVAFAGHPLLAGGQLVGVIALFARHPLGREALEALAAVADAVAAGARRLRAEERERSVLVTLDRIGRTLVAELDLERAVQTVTDAATELPEPEGPLIALRRVPERPAEVRRPDCGRR